MSRTLQTHWVSTSEAWLKMVPKVNWFEEGTRVVLVKNFELVMTVLAVIQGKKRTNGLKSTIRRSERCGVKEIWKPCDSGWRTMESNPLNKNLFTIIKNTKSLLDSVQSCLVLAFLGATNQLPNNDMETYY